MNRAQVITALLASDMLIDLALEGQNNQLERQANTMAVGIRSEADRRLNPDPVEVLFDLLPASRIFRQTDCIHHAQAERRVNQIQHQLNIVGQMLRQREKFAKEKGLNAKLYSSIFQKESERLQELQASRNAIKAHDAKHLESKQIELSSVLCKPSENWTCISN